MPGPPPLLACALALATLALACADDRVVVNLCDDGVLDGDQVCLGGPPRTYAIGLDPVALRVADFDSDGLADALVVGLGVDGVAGELRLSRGSELSEAIDPGLHGCSAHPVTGDIDGDPYLDLLVAACEPELLLFHGSESGRLSGPEVVAIPATPRIAALVDIDDDGDDDLAVLGDDGALHLLLAAAPGVFGPGPATAMSDLGPLGFALADADGDRVADLIVLTADDVRFGRGLGGGLFDPPSPLAGVAVSAPIGLASADIDGDGRLDLLTREGPGGDLVLLRGDGEGGFAEGARIELAGAALGPLLTADLDGDGDREVLVGDPVEPQIDVWRSREGGFAAPIRVPLPVTADQLGVGDLNGDGAPDLIAATFAERSITVILADP